MRPRDLPDRVQRRRTKGWRMPQGVVYVGRGSRWGNPFVVGVDGSAIECMKLYVGLFYGMLCISKRREHVADQERVAKALQGIAALKGKPLACWCRADRLCHADVLLHIANEKRLPDDWLPRFTRIS